MLCFNHARDLLILLIKIDFKTLPFSITTEKHDNDNKNKKKILHHNQNKNQYKKTRRTIYFSLLIESLNIKCFTPLFSDR